MFKFLKRLTWILLILGALAGAAIGLFALTPSPLIGDSVEFDIPSGMGLRGAAQVMFEAGVGFRPWQFALLGRLAGQSANIKAGSYEVTRGITPWGLLEKLTRGDVTQAEVTLVEGKTFRQWRTQLDAHPFLRHDSAGLSEAELLLQIGATEKEMEGLLYPDTYLFSKNTSDIKILKRSYRLMQKRLDQAWQSRKADLPVTTPYQALIIASLVEKETGLASDRPLIASVFFNRLRSGMLLQTDPSVIYGLGESFDGNLTKRHLLHDTPYNTYTRPGLPPTPIAMPSLASLNAVLQPPTTDKYYFVARGDGSSVFSTTLEQHNRAVARYQKRHGRTE